MDKSSIDRELQSVRFIQRAILPLKLARGRQNQGMNRWPAFFSWQGFVMAEARASLDSGKMRPIRHERLVLSADVHECRAACESLAKGGQRAGLK